MNVVKLYNDERGLDQAEFVGERGTVASKRSVRQDCDQLQQRGGILYSARFGGGGSRCSLPRSARLFNSFPS